jgi:hypothetical protein
MVAINELVQGVGIALGQAALSACPVIDRNGNGVVSVDELLAAVNALLNGCPALPSATPSTSTTTSPSSTPTSSPTITPTPSTSPTPSITPTPTPTVNRPPLLPTASIYRAFAGSDIELPLVATDPDGGTAHCSAAALPAGAVFDPLTSLLSWTPGGDQLGPFYVPYTCTDDAQPPASADGELIFAVAPRDTCAIPSCDAAVGCTSTLPPLTMPCCSSGPAARVAEPATGCPAGRVLYIGRNIVSGFGRLQNCDVMRIRNFAQSGAEALFHIETRCMNTFNRVQIHARLESTAPTHPLLFDTAQPPVFLDEGGPNGFATRYNLRWGVNGPGPFFDIEGAEATLTVTVTDSDNVSVSQKVRLLLTFNAVDDLPDVDPANTPTPTSIPTSTPG